MGEHHDEKRLKQKKYFDIHKHPKTKNIAVGDKVLIWQNKTTLKGKVHPKNMLVSDVRSDKIGKNAIDCFSISPLVLKIFAFKVEELVRWSQSF